MKSIEIVALCHCSSDANMGSIMTRSVGRLSVMESEHPVFRLFQSLTTNTKLH